MTNTEETIKILKTWRVSGDRAHEAMDMAIKALEKQIPMKPGAKELAIEQPFKNKNTYVLPCGNCGEALNFLHSYCPWCGQKIGMEDET